MEGTKQNGRNRKRLTADEIITAALRQRMISEGRIRAEEEVIKAYREYQMAQKAIKKMVKEEEINEMVGDAVGEEIGTMRSRRKALRIL
ncbi:hypothetical protein KIN20_009082 [Parelaphostrongylus tenuis]|uniref:Uncharacterized protein n=1 Tax=Parelaphostrongylus tenuis TaxID=148309 RepID=A0AAD5M5S4_PARTN|nr:hypothetical protein KIN20_009082 [Parelaphostrongylus tenuis]